MNEGDTSFGGPQVNPGSTDHMLTPQPQAAGFSSLQNTQTSVVSQAPRAFSQSTQSLASTGDIVLSAQPDKKKRIVKVVVAAITVLLIAGGIAAFFLIRNANRQDFISKANALVDALSWTSYSSQCINVTYNFDDTYTLPSDFEDYVNDCKQNTAEIQSLMTDIKGRDSSPEYTEIYDSLSSVIDSTLVTGEDLEYSLNIYSIWHNWLQNTSLIDPILTEGDRQAFIAPLLDSGNETLINYAMGWAELQRQVTEAYIFASAHDFEQEYADRYNAAYQAQIYYERDNRPDWDTLLPLNRRVDDSDIGMWIMVFNNYIEEEYGQ